MKLKISMFLCGISNFCPGLFRISESFLNVIYEILLSFITVSATMKCKVFNILYVEMLYLEKIILITIKVKYLMIENISINTLRKFKSKNLMPVSGASRFGQCFYMGKASTRLQEACISFLSKVIL